MTLIQVVKRGNQTEFILSKIKFQWLSVSMSCRRVYLNVAKRLMENSQELHVSMSRNREPEKYFNLFNTCLLPSRLRTTSVSELYIDALWTAAFFRVGFGAPWFLKNQDGTFSALYFKLGSLSKTIATLKTKMKPVISVNDNLKTAPVCQSPTGCNLNYFSGRSWKFNS